MRVISMSDVADGPEMVVVARRQFFSTKPKASQNTNSLAVGIRIGIAIGAGIGVAINNIAIGVGCGIALGVAIGAALRRQKNNAA
jgi:hypothetical protein